MQTEICICAALQMPDGYIVRGHRHDDCYITIGFYKRKESQESRYDKGQMHQAVQGFLTTENRFVDRYEGMRLMKNSGLSSVYQGRPFEECGDMLFSEDLY